MEFETRVGYFKDPSNGATRRYDLSVELRPAQMRTDIYLRPVPEGAMELSFMGDVPKYSAGQNIDDLRRVTDFAQGWTPALRDKVARTWERWHGNGGRAGCVHQLVNKWNERPIDSTLPTHSYGVFFPEQRQPSWNMLAWIPRGEHPEGLLGYPCETCGYKYGSQWLHEMLPDEIINFVESLPRND